MQQPILGCFSQRMQTLFSFAVFCILDNDQWVVEEDTFGFGLTDVMLIRTLAAVAVVPVKTGDLVKVNHYVYAQHIQSGASTQYGFRLKGRAGRTCVCVAASYRESAAGGRQGVLLRFPRLFIVAVR